MTLAEYQARVARIDAQQRRGMYVAQEAECQRMEALAELVTEHPELVSHPEIAAALTQF